MNYLNNRPICPKLAVGTKDVGWQNSDVVAAVLFAVAPRENFHHALGVGVSLHRSVWRSLVQVALGGRALRQSVSFCRIIVDNLAHVF